MTRFHLGSLTFKPMLKYLALRSAEDQMNSLHRDDHP
jgi:hypothetical protein